MWTLVVVFQMLNPAPDVVKMEILNRSFFTTEELCQQMKAEALANMLPENNFIVVQDCTPYQETK